jgi:flagellar biosynthesis protein FlhF
VKVKSYYAASIEAAMSSAAQEMGPEAVLITSRRTTAETKSLGEYEVVFGVSQETGGRDEAPPRRPAATVSVTSDLDLIRREIEGIHRALNTAWRHATSGHWTPEMSHAEAILTDADVPFELKDDLLCALDARLREELLYDQARSASIDRRKPRFRTADAALSTGSGRTGSLLREQLNSMLEISPPLPLSDTSRSIVALVGPSGSGKTTTIVKLAIQYGLTARRPPLIVSTDTFRVGATEQLRLYAAAIGVSFQVAETPLALRQILEEHGNKQLVLIDTPGLAPADMDASQEMARFLSLHPDIDVHLLLPATARALLLAKIAKRFAPFGASTAIITKLDEAESMGAAVGQAILSNLPVSFVTTGQQVPDDLIPADKEYLLSFLGRPDHQKAASVA